MSLDQLDSTGSLPVADGRQVRSYVASLLRRHPRMIWSAFALHAAAALAALAGPRLLGDLVAVRAVRDDRGPRRPDRRAARGVPGRTDAC